MTTSHLIIVVIATLGVLASSISAKEYIVGDESGWTLDFDYQTWAKDKVFFVGDTLVFNYASGAHTVVKVNGTGFQQCIVSPAIGTLTSGRDVVPLQTAGRKWYICGVGKHCESKNMKLVITVLPQTMVPAPSPMATSTSNKLATPTCYRFVAILFGSLLLLLV
ncbi:basic blue protein-like [Cynara cardunculus var. scolymus]|uniref:Cupredoxin n=1 Tax=Cynara cardunculus var. scolymus TaxID=59895 RepID=A0A103XJG6_CYNCS|nr:basic blue protein-like [Cynara cardunculus var. scolymus]KVH91921.1 Cupredoxin [Cynara cardunculus var. scolymus]